LVDLILLSVDIIHLYCFATLLSNNLASQIIINQIMEVADRDLKEASGRLDIIFDTMNVQMGPIFASIVVSIIPMLIIYLLFQNQVQSGMVAGAVKE